jgi:hypothetical protein
MEDAAIALRWRKYMGVLFLSEFIATAAKWRDPMHSERSSMDLFSRRRWRFTSALFLLTSPPFDCYCLDNSAGEDSFFATAFLSRPSRWVVFLVHAPIQGDYENMNDTPVI